MQKDQIAVVAKTAERALFDVARADNPRLAAQRGALLVAFDAAGAGVDMHRYTEDVFPLEGCSIVLRVVGEKFVLSIYAPTFVPHGSCGLIESHAPRALGEIGAVVDALVKGEDVRFAGKKVRAPVLDQSAVSGSTTTE